MPASSAASDSSSDESSTSPAPAFVAAGRRNFEDEEEEDSEVLESWDAAEDSEAERDKARKAAEAKAATQAAAAAAAAAKQPKKKRIAQLQAEREERLAQSSGSDDDRVDETDAQRRERLRRTEQAADLEHAEDLFGGDAARSRPAATAAATTKPVAVVALTGDLAADSAAAVVNLAALPLFRPASKEQFDLLRDTVAPLLGANAAKARYPLFLIDLVKKLAQDLNSEQTKKLGIVITTLGNEKMKREKEADKSSKKSKAQKTKFSLVASRPKLTDVAAYDDGAFGEDDFM